MENKRLLSSIEKLGKDFDAIEREYSIEQQNEQRQDDETICPKQKQHAGRHTACAPAQCIQEKPGTQNAKKALTRWLRA